jgi:hypothetical protein
MILQLTGLFTVVFDVVRKQTEHKATGLVSSVIVVFKQVFRRSSNTVLVPQSLTGAFKLSTPKVVIAQTTEDRVTNLETRMTEVVDYAAAVRRDLDTEVDARKSAWDQIVGAVNDAVARIQTGGLRLSLFGIICLAWGIILGSIPIELADLFS